jgi:hypothetical protein
MLAKGTTIAACAVRLCRDKSNDRPMRSAPTTRLMGAWSPTMTFTCTPYRQVPTTRPHRGPRNSQSSADELISVSSKGGGRACRSEPRRAPGSSIQHDHERACCWNAVGGDWAPGHPRSDTFCADDKKRSWIGDRAGARRVNLLPPGGDCDPNAMRRNDPSITARQGDPTKPNTADECERAHPIRLRPWATTRS